MKINILYFGDVVGAPGRAALRQAIPQLREQYDTDVIFVNAENTTHGRGLNAKHYQELLDLGVDAMSSGDHIWTFTDLFPEMDKKDSRVIRPANYPDAPGRGYVDLTVKGKRVRLINLIGRVFMNAQVDSPFHAFDRIMQEAPTPDVVVVDFHAEATSEKRALAEYVSGRAQVVVGTHTHVPTADARILNGSTAFISDLGMVGPSDSSLGADKNEVLKNFLTGLPWRYTLGAGECELGAIFTTVDITQHLATRIEHIRQFINVDSDL